MDGDINMNACRVCLIEDTKPLNIFENPSRKECFAIMLTAIADIKIFKGDNLPENVCSTCSEVIIKAFKLKLLAKKTNAFLIIKSKQIIIKKLDPELIKFKNGPKIKIAPIVNKTTIQRVRSKTPSINLHIFDEHEKKVNENDIFSEPPLKKTKKIPLKRDIFFNDNNINDNENLSGNDDDHFADNDDFDISFLKSKVKVVPKPMIRHVPYNEGFVCTVCGLKVSNIQQHMNTHKEHKFTCPVCKMEFAQKSELLRHTTMAHSDVTRNFSCDVCPLKFFTMKSLRRHKSTHAEKKFECDKCKLRFNSRWALVRHIRSHLGVKAHVCECGQAFLERATLLQHSRVHTGVKPYECQICDVSFSYKCNLNNHVLKHHGINIKFKSLHKVTEDTLRLLLERTALDSVREPR